MKTLIDTDTQPSTETPVELMKQWRDHTWKALFYLNIFRFSLALIFCTMAILGADKTDITIVNIKLFLSTSFLMLATSIIYAFAYLQAKSYSKQIMAGQFIIDLILCILIIHACGSLNSHLGFLLYVVVGSGSVVLPRIQALALAAGAIILMFYEHFYSIFSYDIEPRYSMLGFLGAALFATSLIISNLARRARIAEASLGIEHEKLLALEEINQLIITESNIGIIVVNEEEEVISRNPAADYFAYHKAIAPIASIHLRKYNRTLHTTLKNWKKQPSRNTFTAINRKTKVEFSIEIHAFGYNQNYTTLLLTSLDEIKAKASEMTLAALGRLSASIAHEIRNPLTSISAANDMLSESTYLPSADLFHTDIIQKNCQRINHIIEDVLRFGSSEATKEVIELHEWIEQFLDEFCSIKQRDKKNFLLDINGFSVTFFRQHLHQLLTNLCENAILHSKDKVNPKILLHTFSDQKFCYLDIINEGARVPKDIENKIFEPFFTTKKNEGGTGLGLYLCKQICELNDAKINLIADHEQGTCFRITFNKL